MGQKIERDHQRFKKLVRGKVKSNGRADIRGENLCTGAYEEVTVKPRAGGAQAVSVIPREFEHSIPDNKGILGSMDESGVVTFVISAGKGSSIRGTELFNRMMQFFGDQVRAIHGQWVKGPLGYPSTNIDKVNELTAMGVPLEEAIQHTWRVTRARKLGYDKVRLLKQPVGKPGIYSQIDVLIEK